LRISVGISKLAIGFLSIVVCPCGYDGIVAIAGGLSTEKLALLDGTCLYKIEHRAQIPLVIADIMRGTGRYNLAQGAIATVQGIGAALSGLAAGEIVDHFATARRFSP
jgi:hypothetical protein